MQRWTDEEELVIRENYGELTYTGIANKLPGRTWSAVRHRAALMSLTKTSNLGRKYCANRNFFARPTVENSYWAGFLAADGNVCGKRLSVGLALKDAAHVERLRIALEYTGKLYFPEQRVDLSVTCSDMVRDLRKNFNITERKSLTLKPPPIVEENLIQAFIVGVIDGDGSITTELKQNKYLHPRITVYGTKALLEWVKRHFDEWAPAGNRAASEVRERPAGTLHAYRVTAGRAKAVGRVLLAVNAPRLSRKWGVLTQMIA